VERVVDIKGVPEANELLYHPRQGLRLGAAVPCYRIYGEQRVARAYPGLMDAVAMIGGIQIQGRASVGGNLCNAAPSADAIPPLIALGAVCAIAGPGGRREVPVEQFCTGPGRTVLQPGELLLSLHLPPPKPRSGAFYLRFIPRNEMDIAVAGVGASVVLDGQGETVAAARIALAAVAPTPLLAERAGAALVGKRATEAVIQEAAAAAQAAAPPHTPKRGAVEQRRHLVGVLTQRALRGALQRAQGGIRRDG
jgi:carbon-monoxide dehydrogenase medium subunit